MQDEILQLTERLLKPIGKKKVAIFCGAGISYNSGLPLVSELLEKIFSKLELSSKQIQLINNSKLPFERIMESVLDESALDEIIDIFEKGIPNTNHILIAKLVKKSYLKIICTTNFDTLIERALEKEGLIPDVHFKVLSTQQEFNSFSWKNDIAYVIKIHGCVTKKQEIAITLSLIASEIYSLVRKKIIQEIFGGRVCDDVLVLGYSCSDLDLVPLIESIDGKKANVLFIEHQTNPDGKIQIQHISDNPNIHPFKTYSGLRIFINTDELVKSIWNCFFDDIYLHLKVVRTTWQENIEQWYSNATEESGVGVKHHISSRLLYNIGEYKEAISHNKKAISIALSNSNLLAYSSELGNMAMALNAIQDYKQAKYCLEKSIPLCKRIDNIQGLSSQIQALARTHHLLNDNEKAIGLYEEAQYYAKVGNDDNALCAILGEVSNCYIRLGRCAEAKDSLNKALILARKLGNMQTESSVLGILAQTYFLMGEYSQSIDFCIKGIKIKKSIGDRSGEQQLLDILSSIEGTFM